MKKSTLTITALSLALVFTFASSVFQTVNAEKNERIIYSANNKAFYELTENIEKIDLALKKAALATDSHSLLQTGAMIRECAAFAISDLGEMESDAPLTNMNTFLNQAGDYVKSVALSHSDGSAPSKAEQDNFLMLSRFSTALTEELLFLRSKIASGEISYSQALKSADETLGAHLARIESEHFTDYEPLSYDGSFSAHMKKSTSNHLSSFPEITAREALNSAFSYLYGNVPFIYSGETEGTIPSFMFYCNTETSLYSIEITKNGGKLLYYTESRPIKDAVVGTEEAVFHALKFSEEAGFPSLTAVFYENTGGILSVTLAPYIDDVIYYTDTIEVEIALDTASVVGFNAGNYLMNHKERSFPDISDQTYDTLSKIHEGFFPKTLKKAYIPTEYGKDLPCLEVMGKFDNRTYLIYINAETGIQEEILLLSQSDSGYFAQ